MFVSLILLTSPLVIVSSRNLNTEAMKDHVPMPKYDFSSHEVDFTRNSEREDLSSDGFRDHSHRDFHNHRGFNMEFNHRQFPRSENERDFGSSVHDGPELSKTEFHDISIGTSSSGDSINSSRGNKHKERFNHTTESRDSDFGLETFESDTKNRHSNVEEPVNADRRQKSKNIESNYSVERHSPDLSFGGLEETFQGNNFSEPRSINKRINQNNMQRSNFHSNFFNSRPEFNDRKIEEQNANEFGVQIQDNEKYFDTLSSSYNQKSNNNNERIRQNQKNRQNIELITGSYFNNRTSARMQHKDKTDNELNTRVAPKQRNPRPSSRDNVEMDQRPIFQTSAKPVVNNNEKESNGEVWVWPQDSKNKPPATNSTCTEPSVTTPGLDDRAAFNGDKCPTGTIRVRDICADVD